MPGPDCFTLTTLFSPSYDGSFPQILLLCSLCLAGLKKSVGLGRWEGMVGGFFLEPLSLRGKKLGGVVPHLFPGDPRVLTPSQGCYFNALCFLCPLLTLCALTVCTHQTVFFTAEFLQMLSGFLAIQNLVCVTHRHVVSSSFFSKCHPDCLLQNHLRSLFKSSSRPLIKATDWVRISRGGAQDSTFLTKSTGQSPLCQSSRASETPTEGAGAG